MAETGSIAAWIALFTGFYALALAAGELRGGNGFWMILKDLERGAGLRFVLGVIALTLGATIYLVTPWRPDDWLSIVISVLGGLHVAIGLMILSSGERFMHAARSVIGRAGRVVAGIAALAGMALILAALSRLDMV